MTSSNKSAIAYYDNYGHPRSADGFLVITITFAPELSPLPSGTLSNVEVNPSAYRSMPIYTLPASYINLPRVGGAVAIDKSKLPVVIPIANVFQSKIEMDGKIAEQRFDNFLARKDVKLTKFKKFITQGKYSAFHGGLMSVISIMKHIPKVWEDEVIKPNDEIIFLKNRQLEVTNRINIITDDINQSTEILNEYKEEKVLKEAVQFTSNFYQEVFTAYGEKAEQLAEKLAKKVKGKKIRNIDDAMKAFEKYKDVLNKKFSVKDRQAITNALKSLKYDNIAKNFIIFGKAFGYVGKAMDAYELYGEFIKANETNEWRPFFVKAETLAVGGAASFLSAFTFAILLGNPIGILGYAFIIAIVGMLIDDELIESVNELIGV